MSDFKNWQDKDKLTGVDYTYERNLLTGKIENANYDADFKNRKIFILDSEEPQEGVYQDSVWMDTSLSLLKIFPGINLNEIFGTSTVEGQYNLKNSASASISNSVTIEGEFRVFGARVIAETSNESYLFGVMQKDQGISVEDETSNQSYIFGVMQADLSTSVEDSISSSSYMFGVMQADLSIDIDDAQTTSSSYMFGQSQMNMSISIDDAQTSSTSYMFGQAQADLSFEIDDPEITPSVYIFGVAQKNLSLSLEDETSSSSNVSAQGQMNLGTSVEEQLLATSRVTGVSQTDLTVFIADAEISNTTTLSAQPQMDVLRAVVTETSSTIVTTAEPQADLSQAADEQTSSTSTLAAVSQMDLSRPAEASTTSSISVIGFVQQDLQTTVSEATSSQSLVTGAKAQYHTFTPVSTTSSVTTAVAQYSYNKFLDIDEPIEGSSVVVGVKAGGAEFQGYLIQARSNGASAPVDFTFSDIPEQSYYLPEGLLVTIRQNTPPGTGISFEAPLTVNYDGDTWNFESLLFTEENFVPPANTGEDNNITTDNIYEFYYSLPPTDRWDVVGAQAYSTTFSVFSDNDIRNSTIIALVTSAYPPENYSVGYIARVQIYNYDMEFIGTKYVKKFV